MQAAQNKVSSAKPRAMGRQMSKWMFGPPDAMSIPPLGIGFERASSKSIERDVRGQPTPNSLMLIFRVNEPASAVGGQCSGRQRRDQRGSDSGGSWRRVDQSMASRVSVGSLSS